ncbi:MAG TPA: HAD family hydrolase [Spirochaetia bacterium]|nr:HAD family hydrolase [Spirochaetia bacterium]
MRRPEAILFDLWGTLIDSVAFDPRRGNEKLLTLAENPRGATLEEVQELGRRLVVATVPREEQAALEFTQVALFRILSDSFDLRFRTSLAELEWEFWNASLTVALRPGATEMLEDVRNRGIRTCVISNSSFAACTIERELDRQGLMRYFEFVISSADYGIRKPDALIFEAALLRMGVSPQTAWFVGDNVGYDIIGARQAGLFPIAYNAHASVPESVGEYAAISHWREMAGLFDQPRQR